jgi:hypothetical protein
MSTLPLANGYAPGVEKKKAQTIGVAWAYIGTGFVRHTDMFPDIVSPELSLSASAVPALSPAVQSAGVIGRDPGTEGGDHQAR